jgi:hypothetical protein
MRVVGDMPPDVLARPRARHNLHIVGWQPVVEHNVVTLAWFIGDYVGHLRHHLRQVVPAPVLGSVAPLAETVTTEEK